MKKLLLAILTIAILMLSACGEGENVSSIMSKTESKPEVKSVIPKVNDYSEHTYNVTDILENLKLDGRYAETVSSALVGKEKCITFDNTAQMIAFNADCEGNVILNLTLKVGADKQRATHYFLIYVDGVEQERAAVEGKPGFESKQQLTVAKDLSRGKHSFKIYRQTELLHGIENIVSITMNGVPIKRPEDSDLYIEFLGDSITAGYGDLTVTADKEDPMQPAKSDGTKAYAFVASQKLGADVSIVARSGLAYSYDPVNDYWKNISASRNYVGKYEFKRQPDIVVVSLGTNDHNNYKSKGLTLDDLQKKAVELLKTVREDCPKSKIIWAYGMGEAKIRAQITNAVAEAGGEKKGFYYFENETCYAGGQWHPSAEQHEQIAQHLADYIKSIQ